MSANTLHAFGTLRLRGSLLPGGFEYSCHAHAWTAVHRRQMPVKSAAYRVVNISTIGRSTFGKPHLFELCCPGALGYTFVKIRGIGYNIPLVITTLILYGLRIDPFAVFSIGCKIQLSSIPVWHVVPYEHRAVQRSAASHGRMPLPLFVRNVLSEVSRTNRQ